MWGDRGACEGVARARPWKWILLEGAGAPPRTLSVQTFWPLISQKHPDCLGLFSRNRRKVCHQLGLWARQLELQILNPGPEPSLGVEYKAKRVPERHMRKNKQLTKGFKNNISELMTALFKHQQSCPAGKACTTHPSLNIASPAWHPSPATTITPQPSMCSQEGQVSEVHLSFVLNGKCETALSSMSPFLCF